MRKEFSSDILNLSAFRAARICAKMERSPTAGRMRPGLVPDRDLKLNAAK